MNIKNHAVGNPLTYHGNRVHEKADGSRFMEIQVGSHMEWRAFEEDIQTFNYVDSDISFTTTYHRPALKEGEEVFRCRDGRLAVLPPAPAALEVMP